MDISDLMDLARQRAGLPTDAALARRLGKSHNFVCGLRKGYGRIGDESLVALCSLARVDPLPWLLDLNIERTQGEARRIYRELAQSLASREPKKTRAMVNAAAE